MRLEAAFFLANFEDTVTYFDKDMFRKNLSVVQTPMVKRKQNFKVSLFKLSNHVSLCLLFCFK